MAGYPVCSVLFTKHCFLVVRKHVFCGLPNEATDSSQTAFFALLSPCYPVTGPLPSVHCPFAILAYNPYLQLLRS